MIRKTFICVVGVLTGVSGAAYLDGFFEKENVVTDAYHQVVSQFKPTESPEPSGDEIELAMQNETTTSDSSAAIGSTSVSPVSKLSDAADAVSRSSSQAKGSDRLTDPDAFEMKSSRTVPSTASTYASEKMQDSAENTTRESEVDADDVVVDPMKDRDNEDSTKVADKQDEKIEDQSLEKAKALALLDVRFSRETFKSTGGGQLNYRKLSPRIVGTAEPTPLIVFLHGSGERGDDNTSQLKHGLSLLASREGMKQYPATIIAPQCPQKSRWTTTLADRPGSGLHDPTPTDTMRLTLELIDSIRLTDNVDPNRIYVTGLSMGGFGTFDLIARRPSMVAAAVPLCGGGDTSPTIINRIKEIPLWIIHGDEDPVVKVEYSREMVAALESAGGAPRYSELTGFQHNIWDAAYSDDELYKWMFNQSKSGPLEAKTNQGGRKQQASVAQSANAMESNGLEQRRSSTDAQPRLTKSTKSLRKALQSQWKVLAATQRGRRADAATLAKMQVSFTADSLIIKIGDRSESAKFALPTAQFSPYPWIDMISQRSGVKDSAGILAMQGDKLVICWALPGEDRPTTFDSREGVKTLVLEKK